MTAAALFNSLRRLTESGDAFCGGVRAKIEDRSARWLVGGRPGPMVPSDQSVRFKDLLANAAVFDRELLARTPANPSWRWVSTSRY